jgi:acetate kinase
MKPPAILVVNAGSSSIKFSIFEASGEPGASELICGGRISGIGGEPRLTAAGPDGSHIVDQRMGSTTNYDRLMESLLGFIEKRIDGHALAVAGHRIVHGGRDHVGPAVLDEALRDDLERLAPLAPLHQPHNLAAVEALARLHPDLPQVACFDTAFHAHKPEVESVYAIPRELTDQGIRRYGFHGLSYAYVASRLPAVLGDVGNGRVVVAHLGSGASLCAMKERKSRATTMGFTALDGLPMGTRSGQIDPGVLLYLIDEKGMESAELSRLLYEKSGLLGLSGISNDMRDLLASNAPEAEFAVDYFCQRANREIGSLAAALGGIDALVFTAGIGENAAEIRRRICAKAGWLGLELDEKANAAARGEAIISSPGSRVAVAVIPTNEELVIARQSWRVVSE